MSGECQRSQLLEKSHLKAHCDAIHNTIELAGHMMSLTLYFRSNFAHLVAFQRTPLMSCCHVLSLV